MTCLITFEVRHIISQGIPNSPNSLYEVNILGPPALHVEVTAASSDDSKELPNAILLGCFLFGPAEVQLLTL